MEDLQSQLTDFGVGKVLAAGEHTAQKDRSVDRGNFRVPDALAGVDVGEVIEKAAMVGELFPQEPECIQYPVLRGGGRDVAALFADANGGEPKAGGGDAADFACDWIARVAAVKDHAGFRVRLSPEILESGLFNVFQERLVAVREWRTRRS